MAVDLVGLFGDLVRLEIQLWNRVEAPVQHAHGLRLAWLDAQDVALTRVLGIAARPIFAV